MTGKTRKKGRYQHIIKSMLNQNHKLFKNYVVDKL